MKSEKLHKENTLETKASKKTSNKGVFRASQKEFRTALLDNDFLEDNRKFIPEATQANLDTSIKKLKNLYSNITKNLRKKVYGARTGSGLDVKKEPKWFQITHPVLTDMNAVIDNLSSTALDLSFQEENLSAESFDGKNDEETSDEENKTVLNESKLQEENLSTAVCETKENQNKSSNAGKTLEKEKEQL